MPLLVLVRVRAASIHACSRAESQAHQPHRREPFLMPKAVPQPSIPSSIPRTLVSKLAVFAVIPAIAALLGAPSVCKAQSSTSASPQGSSTTQPAAQPNPHPAPAFHQARTHLRSIPKPLPTPADAAPRTQALVAPAPELPHWPANDQPTPPRIVWDSQGLRIEAANASLSDVLNEVSTLTGAHVDGFASDARVYGQYGPGPARDVLSQLLEGTGYNVIMIGDLGQGTPRQILLSARTAGSAQPAAHTTTSNDDDADVEEPVQAQPPPNGIQPLRAPFNPAGMRPQFPPDMQQRQPGQQPQQGQPGQPGQPQQNPPQQPNQQ